MQKLGKIEAISLIVIIMVNQIILNLSNSIVKSTGSAALLNTIFISILAITFCIIICKLLKRFPNNDILDICEFLFGKYFKVLIGIAYIFLFLLISIVFFRHFTNTLKLIWFPETPLVFILIVFLIPPFILNKYGLKTVSQVNLILMPILLISIVVILFSTVADFKPQLIFPILRLWNK